jgi:hypothetical protein
MHTINFAIDTFFNTPTIGSEREEGGMKYKGNIARLFMVLLAIGVMATLSNSPAMAQDSIGGGDLNNNPRGAVSRGNQPEWGTQDYSVLSIHSQAFRGLDATYDDDINSYMRQRYCSVFCALMAPVNLPTGARIIGWELNAFDNDSGLVSLSLIACPSNDVTCQDIGVPVNTSGTPGYSIIGRYAVSHTVDNYNNSYVFQAQLTGGEGQRIVAARVLYALQVSPAPDEPTFSDVPTTHLLFQYIEALAASGITTGYDDGTFRPSQYITRGQMAVFL